MVGVVSGSPTGAGAVLALAMWGPMGGHNSSWWGAQYAAELRVLLVYLSESLGRRGQNGGRPLGATFFIGGEADPLPL